MAIGAVKLQPVTSGRWTVTAEVASSSLVVPAISFKHLPRIGKSGLGSDRVQLGPCRSVFQHLPYELALRQSFLGHACLRVQIESDPTVRVAKKFLHNLDSCGTS